MLFLLNTACLVEKQQYIFYSLWFDSTRALNPLSAPLETSMLTITPPMLFLIYRQSCPIKMGYKYYKQHWYELLSHVLLPIIRMFLIRPKKKICLFTVTRPTLIFARDPMNFYTEFGKPFLLFNQQQCFIYGYL